MRDVSEILGWITRDDEWDVERARRLCIKLGIAHQQSADSGFSTKYYSTSHQLRGVPFIMNIITQHEIDQELYDHITR